jgi:hypothetical protein
MITNSVLWKPERTGNEKCMRKVLLHYHIFKNAGSTIENILDRSFGECYGRIETADPDGRVTEPMLLDYIRRHEFIQALSSHQFQYPKPAVSGLLFFDICFLRDPFDRIRSMYDYLREKPSSGDPLTDLARNETLGRFVARALKEVPHKICNVQTAILGSKDSSEPDSVTDGFPAAMNRILEISLLGVVDCFDQSFAAGQYLLSTFFPRLVYRSADPVNHTRGLQDTLEERVGRLRRACHRSVYEELVHRNRLDCALVDLARGEVQRRLMLAPDPKARLQMLTRSSLHEQRPR